MHESITLNNERNNEPMNLLAGSLLCLSVLLAFGDTRGDGKHRACKQGDNCILPAATCNLLAVTMGRPCPGPQRGLGAPAMSALNDT